MSIPLPGLLLLAIAFAGPILYYWSVIYTVYVSTFIAVLLLCVFYQSYTYVSWAAIPIFLLPIYWLITITWAPDTEIGLLFIGATFVFVSCGLIPAAIKRLLGSNGLLMVIYAVAWAFLLCTIYNRYTLGAFVDPERGGIRSTLAAFSIVSLPYAIYLVTKRKSVMAAIFVFAGALGSIESGSRTYVLLFVPALFATILALYWRSRAFRNFGLPAFVVFMVIGSVSLIATSESAADMLSTRITGRQITLDFSESIIDEARLPAEYGEDIERRLLAYVGWDLFTEHPIFGAGYMSTPYYVSSVSRYENSAHGFVLFLLGETGLVGTVLFLFILGFSISGYSRAAKLFQGKDKDTVLLELVTLALVLMVGIFMQVYHDFYFYLLLGAGWTYRAAVRLVECRPIAPGRLALAKPVR